MADYEPPADLVQLKADWYAAMARTKQIGQEPNAGGELTGAVQASVHSMAPVEKWLVRFPSADQLARLEAARGEAVRLTKAIAGHEFWGALPPGMKFEASVRVNELAWALHQQAREVGAVTPGPARA